MEYETAKEKITELIKNDVLSARNEKIFIPLVLENEEAAKEVYRITHGMAGFPTRYKIVTTLTGECRGEDIAKEEAEFLVNRLTFRDCSREDERAFRIWLLGETDVMPEVFPMEKKVACFFSRPEYRTICYISKVCEFPARLCVYGMVKGYIELFKSTLQHIITEFGIDYARDFIERLVNRYEVSEAYVMAMVAAIYAGPANQKLESQLYREYIAGWVDTDREHFLSIPSSTLNDDCRKKVFRKLEKEGI